jgi:hypothetical protein
MQQEHKEKIAVVVDLFDLAERRVKEIERLDGNLSIPSINQLRYVGYHLARALCRDSDADISIEIHKSDNHCRRAIYDAHEIGIIFLLESIKKFAERHRDHASAVMAVIPSYADDLAAADEAAEFIDDIQKNHRDDREAYYEQSEPHYKTLRKIGARLNKADPLVSQRTEEKRRQSIRETRRFLAVIALSFAGLVFSGTMLYLKFSGG